MQIKQIALKNTLTHFQFSHFSLFLLSKKKFLSYDQKQKTAILLQLLQNKKTAKAVALVNDHLFEHNQQVFEAVTCVLNQDLENGLCLLAGLLRKKALTPLGTEERYPWLALKFQLHYLSYTHYLNNQEDFSILSKKMLEISEHTHLSIEKRYYMELLKIYFTDTLNSLKIVINPDYTTTPATEKIIQNLDKEQARFRQELLAKNPDIRLPAKDEELTLEETGDHILYMLRKAIQNNVQTTALIEKMTASIPQAPPRARIKNRIPG